MAYSHAYSPMDYSGGSQSRLAAGFLIAAVAVDVAAQMSARPRSRQMQRTSVGSRRSPRRAPAYVQPVHGRLLGHGLSGRLGRRQPNVPALSVILPCTGGGRSHRSRHCPDIIWPQEICHRLPLTAWHVRSDLEAVTLSGPDLLYLVSDAQCRRPVQAVGRDADPQAAVLEGDLDRQPPEAYGRGQAA